MAIRIYKDRIEIGGFTLKETTTGLQFDGVVQAEYYNNADTSFTGSKDGYNVGGYNGQGVESTYYKFNFANYNGSSLVGNLGVGRGGAVGMHSGIAGYAGHGFSSPSTTFISSVEKFTFSSSVNAVTAFEVWTGTYGQNHARGAGCSSAEYGYMCGGGPSWPANTTGYVVARVIYAYDGQSTTGTIASTIAARLLQTKFRLGSCSSPTHGYVLGGDFGPLNQSLNVIERFPFAYELNGADVGDLTVTKHSLGGVSSNTHGYAVGGVTPSTNEIVATMEKFPFASSSTNSTTIANLATAVSSMSTTSSKTEGFVYGGNYGAQPWQLAYQIQKFPTSSDTNATQSAIGGSISFGAGVQD